MSIYLVIFGNLQAQIVSSSELNFENLINNPDNVEIKSYNSKNISNHDPEKNVPDCDPPSQISVAEKKSDLIFNWDNPNNDFFEINIKRSSSSRNEDIIKSNKSSFKIEQMTRSEIDYIYIRRICDDFGKKTTSQWVEVMQAASGPCINEACKFIPEWFTYTFQDQSSSSWNGIRKEWRLIAPPEYEFIELDFEISKYDPKINYQSSWTTVKKVKLNATEYEIIEIPLETYHVRFKNLSYRKFNGIIQTCNDFYATALEEENNCNQNFFYSIEEENNGSNTYEFYFNGPSQIQNKANIKLSNGQEEQIPLIACPTNSSILYSAQYNTCMNFDIGTSDCMVYPVINECENNNANDIDCTDFNFELTSSPYKAIDQFGNTIDENKCFFAWNSPFEIQNGQIFALGGGSDYNLNGKNGLLLLDHGTYSLSFTYLDSDNNQINCGQIFEVSCESYEEPIITEEEIDEIIPCRLVQFEYEDAQYYNGHLLGCNLSWNSPDSVSVLITTVPEDSEQIHNYGSNNGSFNIHDIEWSVSYIISYNHPIYGWITNECEGMIASCPSDETETDSDGDGVSDNEDNCPAINNPNQQDSDGDGMGDVCEPDTDGDSIIDDLDNCVYNFNPNQEDIDQDGIGDICEGNNDSDGDGFDDQNDNCPAINNPSQLDSDNDGIGDVCELDTDGDTIIDDIDNCVFNINPNQEDIDQNGIGDICEEITDSDGDGVSDDEDNCPAMNNPNQQDTDGDGIGDVCEPDTDGDTIIDDLDNCVYNFNTNQEDSNNNGVGDVCEGNNDSDDDGIPNDIDNCPFTSNTNQADFDQDGIGDVCELDTDNDGIIDDLDNCWLTPNPGQEDEDEDNIGDVCDENEENDNNVELDESFICNILSSIDAFFIDDQTVLFKISESILDDIDRDADTKAKVQTQLSLLQEINVQITYTNESGEVTEIKNLFTKDPNSLEIIDLTTISYYIESNSEVYANATIQINAVSIDGQEIICSAKALTFEDEETPNDETTEIPEIPGLSCGTKFNAPENTDDKSLDELKVNNIIYLAGFPLIVTEVENKTAPFKGTVMVPMPFGDQEPLIFAFDGFQINKSYHVTVGSINMTATADQLAEVNLVSVPVLTVDNYCKDPEDVTTTSGSGTTDPTDTGGTNTGGTFIDGIHTGTNTQYDWNGFNADGVHYSGNSYNEYGCTAAGIHHITGEDCDPSQPFSDITQVINDLEPQLNTKVTTAIEALLLELNIDIDNLSCNEIRTKLNSSFDKYATATTTNENDKQTLRETIFGENDVYLLNGMSNQFENPLTLPPEDNTKNKDLADIERYHVDLYLCDSDTEKFSVYNMALNDPVEKEKIKQYIINEISTWTEYEVKELFNPDNESQFIPWLTQMIDKYFKKNNDTQGIGYINPLDYQSDRINIEDKIYEALNFQGSSFFSTASMDFMDFNIDDQQRDAFNFEFDQGFKEVLGINRAYFLEEIAAINGDNSGSMPMKIPTPMNGKTVSLYLDDLNISPVGASIDVYAIIEVPNGKLILQADNVVITSSGVQSAVLKLLSPVELRLFNPAKILIEAENTSLSWTCNGLDGFKIKAQVEICDKYIKPYNLETKQVIDNENVTFDIEAGGSGWMEFHTTITGSHPFVVTKYESWAFELKTLVIDTDSEYTPLFNPMKGYTSNFLIGDPDSETPTTLGPGWKGFYLEKLLINLPEKIKNGNIVESISFNNVLFDDQGASGELAIAGNFMPSGTSGGWGISIDELSLSVMKNNIAGFGMKGEIETPLFDEPMEYQGTMHTDDTYSLVVKQDLDRPKTVPLFLAEAKLTSLEFTASTGPGDEGMRLQASVTGSLEIKGEKITSKLSNIPKMEFTNLTIRNFSEKKLEVESWKMIFAQGSKPLKLFGMEIGFGTNVGQNSSFEVKTNYTDSPNKVGIPMNVNLTFLEDLGVTMGGSFDVVGFLDEGESLHKWKYSDIEMKKFCADGSFSAVTIENACLEWYDNETHGKGFRGTGGLKLDLDPLNISIDMIAEFGSKNGEKYFFLDALSKFPPFAVAPPFAISGFGGGVSYGMYSDFNPNGSIFNSVSNSAGELGTTFSGGTYTPDPGIGLSIKAITLFELMPPSEAIFNGSAFLSVTLKKSGGVDNIQFAGQVNMLSDISLDAVPILNDAFNKLDKFADAEKLGKISEELDKLNNKPIGAVINGYVHLKLDLTNKIFTGDFKVFMNAAGILEGAADDKSVVNAKFRFASEKDWYINIGTPQSLCGVKLDALVAEVKLFAYFDIGTSIPPFTTEHLSEKIRSFVDDNVQVSEAFRQSGGGIMFGMGFDIKIHASIWVGAAHISCGAGFDVMIRKTNASCVGNQGLVGIDGWYAMGQVYAYIDAGLSIAGIDVLNVGLYAVLNAQFPNPVYLNAALKVRIKILGIGVDKTLKLEVGDLCVLETGEDDEDDLGIEVISLMLPFDGSAGIPTDEDLEVNFIFPLEEITTAGTELGYKVTNDTYLLIDEHGTEMTVNKTLNDDNTIMTLEPKNMLLGNTTYTLKAMVDIQKLENGFVTHTYEQEKEISFTTNEAFTSIPFTNIKYAYPSPGMYNFYLKEKVEHDNNSGLFDMINNGGMHSEVTKCFIALDKGQTDVIDQFDQGYKKVITLSAQNQSIVFREFTYNYVKNQIEFSLPTNLTRDKVYKLEVLLMSDIVIDELINEGNEIPSSLSDRDPNVEILGHEGNQQYLLNGKVELMNYSFRVSNYDSFSKKMQNATVSKVSEGYQETYKFLIDMPVDKMDAFELYGVDSWEPLLDVNLVDSRWTGVFNELFQPFERFYDSDSVSTGSLQLYFNKALYMYPINFDGINPNQLIVDDPLFATNTQSQIIKLRHDNEAKGVYQIFINKIKDRIVEILMKYNNQNGCTTNSYQLHNNEAVRNNFIGCVADKFSSDESAFINTYKNKLTIVYPLWADSNNNTYKIELKYILPDGDERSKFSKTFYSTND